MWSSSHIIIIKTKKYLNKLVFHADNQLFSIDELTNSPTHSKLKKQQQQH